MRKLVMMFVYLWFNHVVRAEKIFIKLGIGSYIANCFLLSEYRERRRGWELVIINNRQKLHKSKSTGRAIIFDENAITHNILIIQT